MEKQHISFCATKIDRLEALEVDEFDLIDIEVDEDHTFFVSQTGESWFLTHNSGAPDIDVDVGDRDAVLDVIRTEFGYNNVIPISNVNVFKLKSLVKDVAKFYGIPFEEVNEAMKTVDQDVRAATQNVGDDKNLFTLNFDDAMAHSPSFRAFIEKHPQLTESIHILFKEQRSLGRHAGGVIVLDNAPAAMPLITSGGEPQTPWVEGMAEKFLEPLGFIKYDLLGLETMRLIARTIELILQRRDGIEKPTFAQVREWYNKNLHPDVNSYDDQSVYEHVYHEGRFPGVFQLTSAGAQRLFKAAKPKSIVDIAVLTSIYRPGPLAANVDKIYLKARAGEKFEWGHPLFEKVLGKTNNLLVFQEQVMDLAEHVGGFPKDQVDVVRKAIMKRTVSGNDAQRKKAKELEEKFVAGAVGKGVPEEIAREAYKKILFFSGYGFNMSHAIAYAIDSYMCAWLLTHYEEEWLCSYVESKSGNPEDKARASSEIRALGYQIVPVDINHAMTTWTILPGKKFMPSFLSCKGVGGAAFEEIAANRPYRSLEDLLWNEDGTWKHSKFNKRALESLIKIGAFDSMNLVGEGSLFSSYRQMHHVLVENIELIKKSPKRDPGLGRKNLYELISSTREMEDWSRSEKVTNMVDTLGTVDVHSIVDPKILERFEEKGVKSIEECDSKDVYWFLVTAATPKKTKNGKQYLTLETTGTSGKMTRISCWGWDGTRQFEPYTLCVAEVEKNDFGQSTAVWKLKEISA